MQSTQSAEHKLKLQVFYIILGLFMMLAVLPFSEWFRYEGTAYSVFAINSFSREEYLSAKHVCTTTMLQEQGFTCMCDIETCGVLHRMHFTGVMFTIALLTAIPVFIWTGVNLNRKVRKLRMSAEQAWSCFDSEACMYLGPAIVAGAFAFWVSMCRVNGPEGQENLWDEDFHIGASFQNALFGLGVVAWGSAHYFFVAKKAFLLELSMRNIYV